MKHVQSNTLDFSGQNIYVGIDVHLKSWSVAILSEHSVLKRFSQSPDRKRCTSILSAIIREPITTLFMKPASAAFGYTRD